MWRINGLARDGTTEPVSRDQIIRSERGQGEKMFPISLTTGRVGNQTAIDPFPAERGDHTNLSRFLGPRHRRFQIDLTETLGRRSGPSLLILA